MSQFPIHLHVKKNCLNESYCEGFFVSFFVGCGQVLFFILQMKKYVNHLICLKLSVIKKTSKVCPSFDKFLGFKYECIEREIVDKSSYECIKPVVSRPHCIHVR